MYSTSSFIGLSFEYARIWSVEEPGRLYCPTLLL
jgi:hypothetical protein